MSGVKLHWRWWVRKLPFPRKSLKITFFMEHAHWNPQEPHTYFPHCTRLAALRDGGTKAFLQDQGLWTRWDMMKLSESESDSRNIRVADRGSSKDTPEPTRKTFVAWPWEKAKREQAWVMAQKKLASVKRESTAHCFDSCWAQSNRTLSAFFLNKQKHSEKPNSHSHLFVLHTETTWRDRECWLTPRVKELH